MGDRETRGGEWSLDCVSVVMLRRLRMLFLHSRKTEAYL